MLVNKTRKLPTEFSAHPASTLFQYFSKAFPENFMSEVASGAIPVLFMFEQETM